MTWLARSLVFRPFSRLRQLAPIALIVIWPFAFFFSYVLDLCGIGNDFSQLYYYYKVYLLSMLKSGIFPLWSPTEGCGYPFFSSPFSQPFYPLNLLYYLYFRILGHFSNRDYELFTILAVSLFGVGLFLWLRRLRVSAATALAATLCAEMSLKVTELVRFPNAAHAAAWYPWVLLGITMAGERSCRVLGSIVIGAGLLLLLTAGYPYFTVYAGFLFVPYAMAMFGNFTRSACYRGDMPPFCGKGRFVARVAVPAIASLIVASPLLLHFRALLSQTVDRGTPQLDFAAQNSFSFTEALGGWVFPPVSSMEGWYSFGTICVLLLGYHCVLSILAIKDYREDRVLACMILVWSATVLYFTLGRDSALFTFVWHHVALLNQMRCWSRMTIILVPPIALLLARALEHFGGVLGGSRAFAGRWFLSVFAIIAAATAALQFYYLRQGHFDYYWVHFFKNYPSYIADVPAVRSRFPFHLVLASDEWRFFRMTLWAAAGLLVLLLWRRWGSPKPLLARAFPAAFVVFSAADLCLVSPFQWSDLAAVQLRGEHFDAYALLKTGFSQPRDLFGEAIVHEDRPTYSVAPFENWDFNRHVRVYLKYLDYSSGQWRAGVSPAEKALVTRFYGADSSAARIFFSSKIDQASPPDFMNDADRFAKQWKPSYRVKAYDGDLLRLEVSMPHPGWLSFVDSWDPYWTASVNRQAVPISLLLGGYKAVFVPEGRAEVQFAYRPSFWPKAARP